MSITAIDSNPVTTTIDQATDKIRLRPRRTLNRLALALLAIAVAILGQIFFHQNWLGEGICFYGVAIVLFSRALANSKNQFVSHRAGLKNRQPSRQGESASGIRPGFADALALRGGWPGKMGLWLILLAVGLSFLAFKFFAIDEARQQAWWLYLISLILLVNGGVLLSRGDSWRVARSSPLPNWSIALGLVVVVGLALFMRLYNFSSQPFGLWFDEAEAGLQARQMLQEPIYRPIFYVYINVTGHLLATYALALAWLGDTVYSMRLVSVCFGLAGVLAAYLFGRELRGPRFGLALAFFVAVARWHVNFSRIAMTGIDTPFFEFLSLFFLMRLCRRGRLRDALWAGLSLGFGLVFYTAFRLYVLALLIFAMVAGILWATGLFKHWLSIPLRDENWWPHLGRLTMLLVSVWLVIMPVAKFAMDDPDTFWYRTRQISIFTNRDQPDLSQALWENTGKHLLMFNFKGDSNGRHNLPGEPMLDPAMGILAVLGLGLVLARPRDPANGFFLILFPIALLGGIVSVDFEAPQSLRSIAVMPAVIYFAGLALAALGREAEAALSPLSRLWLMGPLVGLASFMLLYNAFTYFSRQANDFASWNAFSTPETLTGHKMAELGPNYVYYLSPLLSGHSTPRFIARNIPPQRRLHLSDALPIREPSDRPVALFIHPDDVWIFEAAQRLYPDAKFEIFGQTKDRPDPPVVYFVGLQPADLASVQGLALNYYRGRSNSGDQPATSGHKVSGSRLATENTPLQSSRVRNVKASWPDDNPLAMNETDLKGKADQPDFIAEWTGILYVPYYGPYSFRLITPGPGQLEIDGNLILAGREEQLAGLPLAQGNHTIRVQAEAVPGEVALYWQPPGRGEALIPQWAFYAPPVTNHGLLGTFYPNDCWAGQPAKQRIDTFLDTYFYFPPLDRPYTVEWSGMLDAPQNGFYRLGLRAVPEARLFLDGELLVTTAEPDQYSEAAITLVAGLHDIRVLFKDNTDRSHLHLFWTRPGGQLESIPPEHLWPPLGRYPERAPVVTGTLTATPIHLAWLRTIGGPGSNAGQFFEPRDVAVLSNGNLAVADTVNRRVQILDAQGNPQHILIGDEFPLAEPLAVAVNSRDEILILDSSRQWIYRYDRSGNLIDRFAGPGSYLFHPRGMTVFADDTIALADTGNARLAFFSADGTKAGSIGGLGSGPGQFYEPTDLLRDAQGVYFVAEAKNNRIQRLDSKGHQLSEWPIPPAYALDGPHLALAPDGSIFVTESQSRSLLRYTAEGTLINRWQTIGPVSFAAPVGIYFDTKTDQLYVTDIRKHQIYIFKVG